MLTRPTYSSHTTPSTTWDTATISKMGHMIVVGLQKLRDLRQNPSVGSMPSTPNRARDKATHSVAGSWHTPVITITWPN
jgi:hypothetical protein